MPRIWIDYLQFLTAQRLVTQTRRAFDSALLALPITQHHRIWPLYIDFVKGHTLPETAVRVFRRHLKLDPDAAGSLSAPSSAPHPRAVQGQETPREVQVVLRNGGQVNWATVQPSSANDASGYACPYRDRMACRLTGGSKEGAEDPSDKEESSKSAKHAAISASQCRHVANMLPHSGAGAVKLK